jgi:hypothetical protein
MNPLRNRAPAPLYHPGESNRCPGCRQRQWHIGRFSAECGFCGTALILAPETREIAA